VGVVETETKKLRKTTLEDMKEALKKAFKKKEE